MGSLFSPLKALMAPLPMLPETVPCKRQSILGLKNTFTPFLCRDIQAVFFLLAEELQ